MRKFVIIISITGVIFAIWMARNFPNYSLDITSEYSKGKITTYMEAKDIQNITATEFRYKTYFLDQYVNVNPRVETYSFSNYEESHSYEIWEGLLQ